MKKLVLAAAVLLSVSANASQPCAGRAGGTLHADRNYDNALPGQSAPAKLSPAKASSNAKGTR